MTKKSNAKWIRDNLEFDDDVTLRDLFAAACLIGYIAADKGSSLSRSEWAYSQADQMLIERAKRTGE